MNTESRKRRYSQAFDKNNDEEIYKIKKKLQDKQLYKKDLIDKYIVKPNDPQSFGTF